MPVHHVCTLHAGGCLRSISSVSPWYPLVDIPIGVHSPHSATLGHPSRLKIGTLAGPLPAFNCSKEIFAMDILAESRLTFCQGLTVQPFTTVSGRQVCRYQDVSKESPTRGHSFGGLRLKRSVPSSVSSRFRPSPAKKDKSAGHTLAARAGQCSTTCTTVSVSVPHNRHVCRLLSAPTGACAHTDGRCHRTYCIPAKANVATT